VHPGLTKKLSKDIEQVQKRCLKLLHPSLLYIEALSKSGQDRFHCRRDLIMQNALKEIRDPKQHHYLLPPVKASHSQMVLCPT